jgi:hypothetical protein
MLPAIRFAWLRRYLLFRLRQPSVRKKNHNAIYRTLHNGRLSSQGESLTFENPSAFRDRRSHGRKDSSDGYGLLAATSLTKVIQDHRGDFASNAFRSPWQRANRPMERTLIVCPHPRADLLSEITGGPRTVTGWTSGKASLFIHTGLPPSGPRGWLRLNAQSSQAVGSIFSSQLDQYNAPPLAF